PRVEMDATGSDMEVSAPIETVASEAVSQQVESYTDEMTPNPSAETESFDFSPMISAAQETITSTPALPNDLPQANVETGLVESDTPVALAAAEEPVAEIAEVAVEAAEVADSSEAVAVPAEPLSAIAIEETVSEIAVVEKASEAEVEAAGPDTAVAAEISETADPVEVVAEAGESIAAAAVEQPVAEEISLRATPAEAVAEAGESAVSTEAEQFAPEAPRATTPLETASAAGQFAYDEFLKDEDQMLGPASIHAAPEIPEEETLAGGKPIALIDESGDFQLEMDAKNAHVWNELGNVYFNRGAVEDAIIAYSKAIELDRWFAWPYSNLALAYVQKGRFAEAMLLYQRSIELFANDKDKAISWNRLGNVYRRLNDYDNAIAAYQRADELDPDNSTIYLQSRFSLLGSFQMSQDANLDS
ncbi:MAG: tetratricopeptide repeat protein, partial [Chloroflexota bacterium]